jgi:hypothetical protein
MVCLDLRSMFVCKIQHAEGTQVARSLTGLGITDKTHGREEFVGCAVFLLPEIQNSTCSPTLLVLSCNHGRAPRGHAPCGINTSRSYPSRTDLVPTPRRPQQSHPVRNVHPPIDRNHRTSTSHLRVRVTTHELPLV